MKSKKVSKKKRSVALTISAILGVIYSIYIISYFSKAMLGSGSTAEAVGGALATALVTPHMVCAVIGAIFNVIAAIGNKRAFALVGAILYCVGAVIFLLYAAFLIPSIILSFVGYARLKKINKENSLQSTQVE